MHNHSDITETGNDTADSLVEAILDEVSVVISEKVQWADMGYGPTEAWGRVKNHIKWEPIAQSGSLQESWVQDSPHVPEGLVELGRAHFHDQDEVYGAEVFLGKHTVTPLPPVSRTKDGQKVRDQQRWLVEAEICWDVQP